MASEEAALRAKIQAMKNLLQVKQQQQQQQGSFHAHQHQHHTPHYAQRPAPYSRSYHHHHAPPVNRSWNRFSGGNNATNSSSVSRSSSVGAYSGPSMSANKVWRKEDVEVVKSASTGTATTATRPQLSGVAAATANKTWKRPLKVAASSHKYQSLLAKRARSRMQLHVLKLEDGEYAKANGGFSLIRAGVKQPKPASVASAAAVTTLARPSTSVNIGGASYVITKRGNSLKRMTVDEVNKSAAVAKQSALNVSANPASATSRAQAAVLRARNARLKKKHNAVKVRTEYCSFFNRFGYCNKRNDCPYIHDSRRVAICRKFLRNECSDANCLLSHKHDQNKMPVCVLFLRGACTREDCKYRHVKVSRSAQVCQAFLKGYCPDGESCRLKHELPPKKQQSVQSIQPTTATTVRRALSSTATAGSSQGKFVSSHQVESKKAALANDNNDTSEQENRSPSGTVARGTGVISSATERSSPSVSAAGGVFSAASSGSGAVESGGGGLSIRPNIRFRPKNAASGFPSLFSARSALP